MEDGNNIYGSLSTIATVASALAAIASAVAAVYAVKVARTTADYSREAIKSTWLSNSANMVTKFVSDYESTEYRLFRRRFSQQLLGLRATRNEDLAWYINEHIGVVDLPLLGYFENIAYLTFSGVLDEGMVWNKFFWQLERYYLAITRPVNLLRVYRQGNQEPIYREFEALYQTLRARDRKERGLANNNSEPDDKEVERFLIEESRLLVGTDEPASAGGDSNSGLAPPSSVWVVRKPFRKVRIVF
jgi:hypothetical protein